MSDNQEAFDYIIDEINDQHVDVRDVFEKMGIFRNSIDSLLFEPENETEAERRIRILNAMGDAVSTVMHGGILLARGAIRNAMWRLIEHNKNPRVDMSKLSLRKTMLSPHTKIPTAYAFSSVALDQTGTREAIQDLELIDEALVYKTAEIIEWEPAWVQRWPLTLEERFKTE